MNIHLSTSRPPVLRVEGLSKQFEMHHLKRTLYAFENIEFELGEGEFILLKGENGAGKSTLLRTLYRSYLPRAGHAYYYTKEGVVDLAAAADVDIAVLRRREIGFVTQFLNARPRVAADEIVAEPLQAFRHAACRGSGGGATVAGGFRRKTPALACLSLDLLRRRAAEGQPCAGADPAAAPASSRRADCLPRPRRPPRVGRTPYGTQGLRRSNDRRLPSP